MKTIGKIFLYLTSLIISLTMLNSCKYIDKLFNKKNLDDVVVAINENYLYQKDIDALIPKGTSKEDSISIVEEYIKRWATNVLILENAEKNINNAEEINKLVEDYRKTLIVHYYKQNMVKEKVDMPNDDEAIKFYETNKDLFILRDPAVKGALIRIPNNVDIKRFREEFKEIENNIDSVEHFAVRYATKYLLFNEQWQSLSSIKFEADMPFKIEDKGYYEAKDSCNTVLINITSYIPTGEMAPQEMVLEDAKQKLYNQNKMDYLRNFGKNLYDYALKHRQIEIYKK